MRIQEFVLLCALLAACSPTDNNIGATISAPNTSKIIPTSPTAQADETKLFGTWRIVSLNGSAIKRGIEDTGVDTTPRVNFWPSGVGVATGCNGYGSFGVLRGNRYYIAPGASTLIGCSALAAQEDTIFALMRAAPSVTFQADGTLRLKSKDTIMVLVKDPVASTKLPNIVAPSQRLILAGTSWEISVIDGAFLTPSRRKEDRPLVFEADTWSARAACATLSGNWVQRNRSIETIGDVVTTEQACPPLEAAIDASVAQILKSNPDFVTGLNNDLLIAGDGHWLIAVRYPVLVDEASLVKGNWRIASVDGAKPVAPSKPTLSFGAAHYTGSTGCNAIQGNFLAHTRRLFTYERPQTEMGCGQLTLQEARITGLLRASPRIARLASGNLALLDETGQLELERDPSGQAPVAELALQTLDRSQRLIESLQYDGQDIPKNASGEAANLVFTDQKWTSTVGCRGLHGDRLNGDWRAREGRFDLYTDGAPAEPNACPPDQQIWTEKMTRIMRGPSRILINADGEFLLASQDHWITGRTTPQRGAR